MVDKADYIVAITSTNSSDEHDDEYHAFRYSDYGANTKHKALEMYERTRKEASTYSVTVARVVKSTDYFGGE